MARSVPATDPAPVPVAQALAAWRTLIETCPSSDHAATHYSARVARGGGLVDLLLQGDRGTADLREAFDVVREATLNCPTEGMEPASAASFAEAVTKLLHAAVAPEASSPQQEVAVAIDNLWMLLTLHPRLFMLVLDSCTEWFPQPPCGRALSSL